jgi:uncharacterized protein YndB with AHSA1/START domain
MSAPRWVRGAGLGAGILVAVLATIAVVGQSRSHHVITVTRTTVATPEYLWALWSDPANPPRWDPAQEYSRVDGPFGVGQTGVVKVTGQPERAFTVVECTPLRSYTDRFHLPAGAAMDWRHTIVDLGPTRAVTFEVTITGPTALILKPILTNVLQGELPATVDTFVRVAEADMRAAQTS